MYKFVEIEDPVDLEERQIRARRLIQYSQEAILAGAATEQIYVNFTDFRKALNACDRIFQLSGKLETPQGIIFTGPPGASKTTVANYFIRSLPKSNLFEAGFGAIMIRLRASPSQGFLVSSLLHALKYPFTQVKRTRVFAMRNVAFEAIKQRGTKIIFIDQAHCLASQTKIKSDDVLETAATDTLRELMEETLVGLVFLADSSFQGLDKVDKALDDRISVKMSLNHFANSAEWHGFLKAFAKASAQIDLSILEDGEIAAATYSATAGNRRSFRRLIVEAVMLTVEENLAGVTKPHLSRAFEIVNGTGSVKNNPYEH